MLRGACSYRSSFSSASEVWNTATIGGGDWDYGFAAGSFPADGGYTIRVRATDNVGLVETPSSRSFTYDTAAPNTSITANPADPTTSTSATFSFTSTEGGSTFECQLDGGGYASCSSPKSYTGPLSVEWEDSGMDREYGAQDALTYVRRTDFPASELAFDAAMQRKED